MNSHSKTLRLLMPQWQGGNNPPYTFGAELLAWLAPKSDDPFIEVPVKPFDGKTETVDGIVERRALLEQCAAARHLIDAHSPDRVVVFGGDCLVALAPFAYLSDKYHDGLGILWIDAHPDVSTPEDFCHAHAMVLGNLMGEGDREFVETVKTPVRPDRVMFAGLLDTLDYETRVIRRLGLRRAGPKELAENSKPVLDWLAEKNITHLAVHLDLDVLDPRQFRSLLFANPDVKPGKFDGISMGEMTMRQVVRLLRDVSRQTDVVGLAIAEHLPWDALNLKNMLAQFPLLAPETGGGE